MVTHADRPVSRTMNVVPMNNASKVNALTLANNAKLVALTPNAVVSTTLNNAAVPTVSPATKMSNVSVFQYLVHRQLIAKLVTIAKTTSVCHNVPAIMNALSTKNVSGEIVF